MISPINNNNVYNNLYFQGLKTNLRPRKSSLPKIENQQNSKKIQNKFSNAWEKVKNEFANLDEEGQDLLFKCIVGVSILGTIIGVVAHYVNSFIEKVQNLLP